MDNRRVFMTLGVFALFMVGLVISQYRNALDNLELGKKRHAEYGGVHFSGKVTGYKTYRYMNKNCYRICVRLDSVAAKSLVVFDDNDAISINDTLAVFSAGYLNHVLGTADSVAVNEAGSDKIMLYYRGRAVEKRDFSFDRMGLSQTDLKGCN